MSRERWIILGSIAGLLLVGAEVAFRRWVSPKSCVQIINQADGVMEDLVVSYRDTRLALGRLGVGQSINVWLTAGPRGPLSLEFRQKGNALRGFQIPEFDPLRDRQDAFKLVLVVKTNEVQRFMEDDDSAKDKEELVDRLRRWIGTEIMPVK
jgi:hypothetical protein